MAVQANTAGSGFRGHAPSCAPPQPYDWEPEDKNAHAHFPVGFSGGGVHALLGTFAIMALQRRGLSAEQAQAFLDPKQEPEPAVCPTCGAALRHLPHLDDAGNFVFWNPFPERCQNPACVREEDREYRQMRQREAKEKALQGVPGALAGAGLPPRYADSTFSRLPDCTQAAQVAYGYAMQYPDMRRQGRGLYISGADSSGKTRVAGAVMSVLAKKGFGGMRYVSAPEMLTRIRSTFNERSVTRTNSREHFMKAPLLILDDIGADGMTDWAISTISEIVKYRYNQMLPAIYISPYPPEELARRWKAAQGRSREAISATDLMTGIIMKTCDMARTTQKPQVPVTGPSPSGGRGSQPARQTASVPQRECAPGERVQMRREPAAPKRQAKSSAVGWTDAFLDGVE